jgi:hypothetical protein
LKETWGLRWLVDRTTSEISENEFTCRYGGCRRVRALCPSAKGGFLEIALIVEMTGFWKILRLAIAIAHTLRLRLTAPDR